MARIRSIKPEFQNSQSMGRVSRDARLTFIELWPQCDDAGRIRGSSRMLASILFPYDEDAPALIDGWLSELEKEKCIVRYQVDGFDYIEVLNFHHQKIDRPSPSKLPPSPPKSPTKARRKPRERSRDVDEQSPNVRAVSRTVSGPVPEGKGSDLKNAGSAEADECAQAFDAFNRVAEELDWPIADHLTQTRRSKFKARLGECGGLAGWHAAMARARASPFLRGETPRDRAHENWTPDLDFFLQQTSFTKLMEGKYDDRRGASQQSGFGAVIAGARAAIAG